jgi:L-lactate dehydrogenase complex protein LldE
MRIAFFATCIVDTLATPVAVATVRVLERLGHDVEFPLEQTCCGQMHFNSGYQDAASDLGLRLERVFQDYEVIVSTSSSCAAHLRALVPGFRSRLYELSELLVEKLGVEDVGARFAHSVTYHPTCHSLRVARVGDGPLRLLGSVRGLELMPLPRADECCGFGGTFAIKNPDASTAIVDDKCDCIEKSGAEYCTALDASCLLNIGGRLHRRGSSVRPVHLAEILAST